MFKKFDTLGYTSKDVGLQGNYVYIISKNGFSPYQFVPTVPGGNASMSLNGILSLHRMQECSMYSLRGRMGTRGFRYE